MKSVQSFCPVQTVRYDVLCDGIMRTRVQMNSIVTCVCFYHDNVSIMRYLSRTKTIIATYAADKLEERSLEHYTRSKTKGMFSSCRHMFQEMKLIASFLMEYGISATVEVWSRNEADRIFSSRNRHKCYSLILVKRSTCSDIT
jgi:hypothetical protein